jgi:type IV secretory pathway VirJ component
MGALARAVGLALALVGAAGGSVRAAEGGNLGDVHITNPVGAMRGFVILFSDEGGWRDVFAAAAASLARHGALVVGVDLPAYLHHLDAHEGGGCHELVADAEAVSRELQRKRGNVHYHSPILAGVGEGGALAEAILAEAPAATLAGAVSLDPSAVVKTREPLCPGAPSSGNAEAGFSYGKVAEFPGFWTVGFTAAAAESGRAHVRDLAEAGTPVAIESLPQDAPIDVALADLVGPSLKRTEPPGGASGFAGLPLVELPASPPGPLLAIVLSGDGGWRDLDKTIAEALQEKGVSVVGWDSLRYFWKHKTPAEAARDLAAVIDIYAARWHADKVALIGYSFGADVLPFAFDRLSPEAKGRVVQLSLLGLADAADFEISVSGWLGAAPGKDALPTKPALAGIDPGLVQCFYGAEEEDSLCPTLAGKTEVIRTAGGHHFDGDYARLADDILEGFRRRSGAAADPG